MNTLETKSTATIDSREVAKMLGVEHSELLKKLEGTKKADGTVKQVGIIPVLAKGNFPVSDYFIPNTYKDSSGKQNKGYLFTRMGCEFIANKFTGEKGILFTAKYVKRFNEMEQEIKGIGINSFEYEKVQAQKARAQAMLLNAKNRTYQTIMKSMDDKNLSPIAAQVFGLKGLESIFGTEVGRYLPETNKTYSATEVGEMLGGISSQKNRKHS